MLENSDARRDRSLRWAGAVSLAVGLVVGSGDLGAEPRLAEAAAAADAAASPNSEADLSLAYDAVAGCGDSLNQALAGVGARLDQLTRVVGNVRAEQDQSTALQEQNQELLARIAVLEAERGRLPGALRLAKELSKVSDAAHAKVRNLVAALLAERRQSAESRVEVAAAKAEREQSEQAARAQEAALAAWIAGLDDELAERSAQLTDARAQRAQAARQFATVHDRLRQRDRQMAAVRSETSDLRQRLSAAQAELQRRGAENERLTAELAAARSAADLATVMAQQNVAAIEAQIGALQAVAGAALPERPGRPAELHLATLADALPAMPYPKPRTEAGAFDAWTAASDRAELGMPATAEAMTVVADGRWITTSLPDVAGDALAPPADPAPVAAPDDLEIPDIMSMGALEPASDVMVLDDDGAREPSGGPFERGDRGGLIAAAGRLVDGLKATRAEAMLGRRDRVFTVDVAARTFARHAAAMSRPLDPALAMHLLTAKSELVGATKGGIRFYPDGSSTGGRIELELLGERAAVNVRWSTGAVTLER